MSRNPGGALAVDLRRARAARRKAERAAEGASPSSSPKPAPAPGYRVTCRDRDPLDCVGEWFRLHDWTPFPFQEEVWRAYLAGESGLIHAATGTGKTYAAWLGPVLEWLRDYPARPRRRLEAPPLRVLWITPLRALAGDTEAALRAPIEDLGLPWTVESRTGDTPARIRARQRDRLPTALVTTPESLSLLLTREDAAELFDHLELVVVDEWHELLASKRGVQTELALARLRRFRPGLRTLGLSATLGNLDVGARRAARHRTRTAHRGPAASSSGLVPKALVGRCADSRDDGAVSLVRPDRPEAAARGRRAPSRRAKARSSSPTPAPRPRSGTRRCSRRGRTGPGSWRCTTARSTAPRASGWRTGSATAGCAAWSAHRRSTSAWTSRRWIACCRSEAPRRVGRLIQRAGRSGHQPGAVSRLTCVPTNALELVDVAAARDALEAGRIEARRPVERPLDLLAQHAVTVALGGGFVADELYEEVRTTSAFRELTRGEWAWVLDFITHGGDALRAYPEYSKVVVEDGRYVVTSRMVAMRHRLSIGTIVSESSMKVQFLRGRTLGSVEEKFIARLRPGDRFTFAGRTLEFVRDART